METISCTLLLRMDMDWKNWANLVELPRIILYFGRPKEIMICLTSSWFYRSIFCIGQSTSKPYVALRQLVTAVRSKVLGRLSNDDGDVNKNGKKAIGYFEKQQSCTWITIFGTCIFLHLPSLHDYDVKMPNFTFRGGRKHNTTTFFFFSWT